MKNSVFASAPALACAVSAICAPAGAQTSQETAEIDAIVTRAVETFAPVGLSVSVVRGGELVYAQGFGVKHVERGGAVGPDTLFQMASTTKAITAAALGILVDEGLIEWDGRVIDYIPEFRMSDPWVTREFTVRDLLTHRSGLPLGAGDLLHWPDGNGTVEDILAALAHIEPASSFRSEWAYDNILYVVAGEIVTRVTGEPWEDFVETRIFDAIGADECLAMNGRVTARHDFAEPHAREGGFAGTAVPAARDTSRANPAGSGVCSANGLALWAQTLLDEGVAPDGTRILSEETVAELMAPVVPMRTGYTDRTIRGTNLKAYALGWFVQDYHGTLLASHTGAAAGGVTYVGLLPREETGVVILANDQTAAMAAIADSLMLLFTQDEGERPDYISIVEERVANGPAHGGGETAVEPGPDGPASLPLAAYAGTYEDVWYGTVEIEQRGEGLYMIMSRSPSLHGPLEHVRFNTFVARWATPGLGADAYVTFTLGHDGEVESVAMDTVNPGADFSYNFHDLDLRPVE